MNLRNKKKLVARTFNVGIDRVIIKEGNEIKEAITRQDINDLVLRGLIEIKCQKGTKKKIRRKLRRRSGSVKFTVGTRKRDYMTLVRKLRGHLKSLKRKGLIGKEKFYELMKKVKAKDFRSLPYLKEAIKLQGVKNAKI